MITKIVCPTDFSDEATNATEYAAKLAQVLNAELLLVNVHRVPISPTVAAGGIHESAVKAADRLKDLSREINKTSGIHVTHEVDITIQSLTKILASVTDESTMIVMGTGGAHHLHDFIFGTDTYNVIKKVKCPVMLIPASFSYGTYNNILYAEAYEEKGMLALNPFSEFIRHFNADIYFLHISQHDTDISKDVFRAERDEIEDFFKDTQKLNFERRCSEDIAGAIEKFVHDNKIDLVVMAARHRNISEVLFKKKPLISSLSAAPAFPVLVFHA